LRIRAAALLSLAWLTAGQPSPAQPSCARDPEAAARTAKSLIEADNRRDLDAVLDHYTDLAVLLPPSGEVVEGAEAIAARYRRLFADNLVEFDLAVDESVAECGAWAFVRGTTSGTLTPVSGGPPRRVSATFLMILRCDGQRWRVHRLSWADREPPSPDD